MSVFGLIVLFVIIAVFRAAAKQPARAARQVRRAAPPTAVGGAPARRQPGMGDLLSEVRRALEEAARQQQARAAQPAMEPTEFEEEEGESLEVDRREPESLEIVDVARPERIAPDRVQEGRAIVSQRRKWADEQTGPITAADHRAFDDRIRRPEAPPPVSPAVARAARLRDRLIWREILGPPVALRDERPGA
jgi:hypothetical protein